MSHSSDESCPSFYESWHSFNEACHTHLISYVTHFMCHVTHLMCMSLIWCVVSIIITAAAASRCITRGAACRNARAHRHTIAAHTLPGLCLQHTLQHRNARAIHTATQKRTCAQTHTSLLIYCQVCVCEMVGLGGVECKEREREREREKERGQEKERKRERERERKREKDV